MRARGLGPPLTGAIAVAGPGPCFRRQMVEEAQDAGAVALIVSSPDYESGAVRRPTLLDPDGIEIPALYLERGRCGAPRDGQRADRSTSRSRPSSRIGSRPTS